MSRAELDSAPWISTSSSSAPRARSRRPSAPRRRCSCAAAASGCCSTAARARSGRCCAPRSGLVELREVFVSHFHADHYLGLPGMLKTFALRGRELPLDDLRAARAEASSSARCGGSSGSCTYPLELVELRPGDVLERGEYNLVTFPVAHARPGARLRAASSTRGRAASTSRRPTRSACRRGRSAGCCRRASRSRSRTTASITPGRGARAGRGPGRKVVLSGDTAPSATVLEAARGAEVLVHEATFLDEERERAQETGHSTALEAAELARDGRGRAARADAPLEPLLRARGRPRGAYDLPRDRGAEGLRRDRRAVPRARLAAPGQGRRRCTPARPSSRSPRRRPSR